MRWRSVTPSASVAVIEGGLVSSWERLCGLLPGATIYRHDGLVLALSGLTEPTLDAAVPEPGRVQGGATEAVEVLEGLCAAHGARLGVDLATGTRPALEQALRDAGLRPMVRRRGMVVALDAVRWDAGPTVAGHRQRDARSADVADLQRLEVACFGLRPSVAERFLPAAMLDDPAFRTLVAETVGVGGTGAGPELVAKAHGHLRDGALGITGVATTRSARRRGLATALVVELLRGARDAGASRAWLLSEPAAAGVYLGVGFQDVAEWWVWSHP